MFGEVRFGVGFMEVKFFAGFFVGFFFRVACREFFKKPNQNKN